MSWRIMVVCCICALGTYCLAQRPGQKIAEPARSDTLTYWYTEAVIEHALEFKEPRPPIIILLSATGQPRLFLTSDGNSFQLLRVTPEQDIRQSLTSAKIPRRLRLSRGANQCSRPPSTQNSA